MTSYVLLLGRASAGFNSKIVATCAIVGEPSGYHGLSKTFDNEATLNSALENARVADYEMNNALQTMRNGFKSFAPITYDQAQVLGLLASATTS